MSRRDRIARNRYADLSADAVSIMRRYADEGLGFNCTFVDDDMKVVIALAQRAVLAGLTADFSDDMQRRFRVAAEPHRADHEKSLGFSIAPVTLGSGLPEDSCATCGLPKSEHNYNGAAYGICGDYTAFTSHESKTEAQ